MDKEVTTPISSNKKSKEPLLVVLLIISLLAMTFFAWQWYGQRASRQTYQHNYELLQKDMEEMEKLFKDNGLANIMEDDIKMSLKNMIEEYDNVQSNNQALNDSVAAQKEKLEGLLADLENSENSRKWTAHELYKMKKEAETLRKVMRDYVHRIDSLNTLNKELQATIKQKDHELTEINTELTEVKDKSENLEKKVELGSKIQISGKSAVALKIRNSGSQVETSKANRTDMIKGCFTINENRIAKTGKKDVYIRVIDPSGNVMGAASPIKIDVNGKQVEMSATRSVDYQNQAVDLCIFYEKTIEEMPEGNYTVEFYGDNMLLGSTGFALK